MVKIISNDFVKKKHDIFTISAKPFMQERVELIVPDSNIHQIMYVHIT